MKLFTREEAEALIPELEKIFETVADLAAQAELKAASLRRRETEGGSDPAAAAIESSQLQFLAQGMNDWLKRVVELGGVPKGLDPALVDFPAELKGEPVFLCWRLGEKGVTHYHGRDEGFASRKALPRRPSR